MELCMAFIDRGRPETNTFHMHHDEMTITLQDVSFITRLPVDGAAVFEQYKDKDYKWGEDIGRILEKKPGYNDYVNDDRLKLTWLKWWFSDPSKIPSSYALQWKQYDTVYTLACIRSLLLADRSGAAVHPTHLLLLEQRRPSDNQHFAWGLRRWAGCTGRWVALHSVWRVLGRLEAT
ncbi:Protein MAIN-LIKE 1 [Linum grandiflorum]